jgi:peptidoglycan/xylan/chitin deacetylase (PgdA/CDA1 family)
VTVASLLRRGFAGSLVVSTFAALLTSARRRGVRDARRALSTGSTVVLMFHAITDLRDDPVLREYGISKERLCELLDALTSLGSTFIDLDRFLRMLEGEEAAPRRAVLVTFDDGYSDLLTEALPVLRERGIPAVAFAVAGHVGGTNEWDHEIGARALDLAGADDLLMLAEHGIEIGAHGYSHRPLPSVVPEELPHELVGAAEQLESLGLPRPRVLAYPYGSWSDEVAAEVSRSGYAAAFTCDDGVATRSSARHAVPRIGISADDTPRGLQLKVLTARWPEPWRGKVLGLAGKLAKWKQSVHV